MHTLFAIGTRCRVSSCVRISESDANLRAPGCESEQRRNDRCISQIRRATTQTLSSAHLPNYAPIDYAFGSVDLRAGRPEFEPVASKRSTPCRATYIDWDFPSEGALRAQIWTPAKYRERLIFPWSFA